MGLLWIMHRLASTCSPCGAGSTGALAMLGVLLAGQGAVYRA